MSFVLKDRVKETTTVVGTGPATLLGSPARFIPFSNIGDTNTTFYCIVHQTLNEWEVGLGTYSLGANTLTRNTVKASSSANVAVTFSAGTKDIFCCYTAEDAIWLNGPLGTPLSGNLSNCTNIPAGPQGSKIQPVVASVAANAITLTLNATLLDFRSTTLTDGIPITRNIVSPISCVIPNGATMGALTTTTRIAILAIDNAGTVELAVANIAANLLDETNKINTTALSAASDVANVIYSTTARTGVQYRVVGFIDAVGSAGSWTSVTLVQGIGGLALASLSSIGFGQSYSNVTGSRVSGTIYYNITGKPIFVTLNYSSGVTWSAFINEIQINGTTSANANTFVVPPNCSYRITGAGFTFWSELR